MEQVVVTDVGRPRVVYCHRTNENGVWEHRYIGENEYGENWPGTTHKQRNKRVLQGTSHNVE